MSERLLRLTVTSQIHELVMHKSMNHGMPILSLFTKFYDRQQSQISKFLCSVFESLQQLHAILYVESGVHVLAEIAELLYWYYTIESQSSNCLIDPLPTSLATYLSLQCVLLKMFAKISDFFVKNIQNMTDFLASKTSAHINGSSLQSDVYYRRLTVS